MLLTNKLVSVPVKPFQPSLFFAGNAGPFSGAPELLALPKDVRLSRKGTQRANTLAYLSGALVMKKKRFDDFSTWVYSTIFLFASDALDK